MRGYRDIEASELAARLGEPHGPWLPQLDYDEDRFVVWATARTTPRPPSYRDVIAANIRRSRLVPTTVLRELEVGPNRCAV